MGSQMTPEQIQRNRESAARLAKSALGLSGILVSDWTYEQEAMYDQKLASMILQYPDRFTAEDIARAQAVLKKNYGSLSDTSFSFVDFATESFKPLGDAAQSIGNGVLTVANAAKWGIPLLAIGGIVLVAYWANNKLGKPIKLPGAS
jgi:hypothetical protein